MPVLHVQMWSGPTGAGRADEAGPAAISGEPVTRHHHYLFRVTISLLPPYEPGDRLSVP